MTVYFKDFESFKETNPSKIKVIHFEDKKMIKFCFPYNIEDETLTYKTNLQNEIIVDDFTYQNIKKKNFSFNILSNFIDKTNIQYINSASLRIYSDEMITVELNLKDYSILIDFLYKKDLLTVSFYGDFNKSSNESDDYNTKLSFEYITNKSNIDVTKKTEQELIEILTSYFIKQYNIFAEKLKYINK